MKNNISDRVTFDPFYPGKITKQTEKKTDRKTKQQQKFKKIKIIFENSQVLKKSTMAEVQSKPSFRMESQMSTVSTSSTASFYYDSYDTCLGKIFLKIHFTIYYCIRFSEIFVSARITIHIFVLKE